LISADKAEPSPKSHERVAKFCDSLVKEIFVKSTLSRVKVKLAMTSGSVSSFEQEMNSEMINKEKIIQLNLIVFFMFD
jgi:hypothetical protein